MESLGASFSGLKQRNRLKESPLFCRRAMLPGPSTKSTTTDSEGRFAFRNLTVGSYNITAQREGYTARIPFGLRAFATPATAQVLLTETESVADLRMSLIPGGTFTGRVIDADGRPAANVNVRVLQNRYGQIVTISRTVITNDRGENIVCGVCLRATITFTRNPAPERMTYLRCCRRIFLQLPR